MAWSAGLFASQAALALAGGADGRARKAQMPAWIAAAALLVVGGIAVFFHLQHWERIFNGFGHLTSGITQELICIVVLAVVAVAYLVFLRKGGVPKWLAVVAIAVSAVLVVVMAHSYTMAARPAWDSPLWLLYVLGNACVLGPATMALIVALAGGDGEANAKAKGGLKLAGTIALAGSAVNAVASVAFAAALQMSGGSFASVGYYFDPTHPTAAMADVAGAVSAQAPLLWLGAVVVGALVPLAAAFLARRKGDAAAWKLWGAVAVVAALVGAVCMRVVFYELGFSVFMFY